MRKLLVLIGVAALLGWPRPARAEPPATAVDAYLRAAFESTGLPGMSVVMTHGDRVVVSTGLGRDSAGRPVTADTPMRVASVSKSFTAATVLTLVDRGLVDLDAPVAGYLPEFRMADPRAGRITVRELLNQTSGLSDTTVDIGATQRATTLAGYLAALRTGRLAADPGTHWAYCNVNYDVAARLVEVVTGGGFGDAVAERIFEPLGMRHSAVGDASTRPADGFVSLYGVWVRRAEPPGFRGGGAGDVVTTAADMGRWLRSQTGYGRPVVTPAGLATMHAPSAVSDYGMGWGPDTVDGRTLLVHAGNLFTYTAVEAVDPARGYGFAVLTDSAALQDDTYAILLGLVALSDGRTPSVPGGGRQLLEAVLALVAVAALGLGVLGAVRAGRWARRPSRRWWRLIPPLLPAAVLATYPQWVSVLMNGRTVTWPQMTYFAAPLTVTLGACALAGLLTVTVRVIRLRSIGSGP
jgi:CubicO group peptidase (beta-lactamase class C family)